MHTIQFIMLYLLLCEQAVGERERRSPEGCSDFEFSCDNRRCIPQNQRCDSYDDCADGSDEACGPSDCKADEFYCQEGICQSRYRLCDGTDHCADGFDETNCGPSNCTNDQFYCPEKFCVSRCDGYSDCSDGSDEINCGPSNCTADQFFCPVEFCNPIRFKCDGENDCPDASDEVNCTCSAEQFQCDSGECISVDFRCDLEDDCGDNSDEGCGPADCTMDQFYCQTGFCTPKYEVCDGNDDCFDWSDEVNCGPANCTSDGFYCSEGTCTSDTCDGIGHCDDWSDEANCVPSNCTADEFYCPGGFCKPIWDLCNGENDCWDWTDEELCDPKACADDEFHCRKYLTLCVSNSLKCDGRGDCPDWFDEENCAPKECEEDEYQCANYRQRCVERSRMCNGRWSCPDWSDEENCTLRTCTDEEFKCQNGKCIPLRLRCDGTNPCGDFSDLINCPERSCRHDEVTCGNKRCVNAGYKCDGVNDCGNWADEDGCEWGCEEGWKRHKGMCYKVDVLDERITWLDARRRCQDAHSNLTTIILPDDDDFLVHILPDASKPAYIGHARTILPPRDPAVSPEQGVLGVCRNGEMTSKFKFCDGQTDCRDESDEAECDDACDNTRYRCNNGMCISLTYTCDGIDDCGDNSDEETCITKPCSDNEWTCDSGRCIEDSKRCDFRSDCLDNTDEMDCSDSETCQGFECYDGSCIPSSWVGDGDVDCDGYQREDEEGVGILSGNNKSECTYEPDAFGKVMFRFPDGDRNCAFFECTDMYYKCPHNYCIPVKYVCNGYEDCPDGEDELYCNAMTCHGYYRCQEEFNCVHPLQVCDGVLDCPQGDDERYCPQPCPLFCKCYGRVVTCGKNFTATTSPPSDVRKLNISGSSVRAGTPDLNGLHYLAVLILSHCQITQVDGSLNHPNLIELDLSDNRIQNISKSAFSSLSRLKYLDLSNNIVLTGIQDGAFSELKVLEHLNLNNTNLHVLTESLFLGLSSLLTLMVSNSSITKIIDEPFSSMVSLRELDIRQNDIYQFSCCFLSKLNNLQILHAHSYRFCCDSMRPINLKAENCKSYGTETISSCKDLLGTRILRAMLWITALVAMFGNIMVLVYRIKYDRKSFKRSYGVFVTSLSISDCLMGLYMLVIGIADAAYRGSYVSGEYGWRHSNMCKFAGFLSTASSEASCIFISLITLDRFLVIKYPFGQFKFSRRSTIISLVVTWMVAVILAAIPLLPSLKHWELYLKNSVCLALPLSSLKTPGWQYSSTIFVGFNFIMFLFIGVGQILIYWELRSSSRMRVGAKRDTDTKVAWKLFFVAFTDFLCWFPVGLIGIMTMNGFSIDKEVYAWTAVTVLPINSALNPLLYTLPSMINTWKESNKQKDKAPMMDSITRGNVTLSHPAVQNTNKYIGKAQGDMDTLRYTLHSPDMTNDMKAALFGLIIVYLYELRHDERNFEAVNDENIFVSRSDEKILTLCLNLKEDPDRHWQVEDMLYLCRLTRKEDSDVCVNQMPWGNDGKASLVPRAQKRRYRQKKVHGRTRKHEKFPHSLTF